MREAFEKSNRITAMWALPFGAGLALFTPDLVDHVLGRKWEPAVPLVQLVGVSTAIYQLGFNWTAFHRAVGRTRPQTVYAIAGFVAFLAAPLPLLLAFGAEGFGWGLFAVNLTAGALRWFYMRELLPGVRIASLVARAFVPPIIACLPVLTWRAISESHTRGPVTSAVQILLFVAVYATVTVIMERRLLTEAIGYLRRRGITSDPAGTASGA